MVKNKKHLFFILKLGIAGLLLFLLIRTLKWSEISRVLKNPRDPWMIVFALFLLVPNLALQSLRWHYLLRLHRDTIRPRDSVRSLLGGMVTGFITPGRIGEMGRYLFLEKQDQWEAVGLVFVDKFYSFVIILVAGFWSMVIFLNHLIPVFRFLTWPVSIVAILITAGGLFLALHPNWLRNGIYQISLIFPYRDRFKGLIEVMDRFGKKRARCFIGLTGVMYCIYTLQFCLLIRAFAPVPWYELIIITSATVFTKTLLPIALADLGIREGAAVFFMRHLGRDPAAAFNSSLLIFIINILIPTLLGLIFLPGLGAGMQNNRTNGESVECVPESRRRSP
jgi:uncharacterized protein (TIRG00374 family)